MCGVCAHSTESNAMPSRSCLTIGFKLVTLAGKAGTGKTMLAIAAGVAQGDERKGLSAACCLPPGHSRWARTFGYLPGSEQEKLSPWMQPIFDNLEYLLDAHSPRKNAGGGGGGNRPGRTWTYLLDTSVLRDRSAHL